MWCVFKKLVIIVPNVLLFDLLSCKMQWHVFKDETLWFEGWHETYYLCGWCYRQHHYLILNTVIEYLHECFCIVLSVWALVSCVLCAGGSKLSDEVYMEVVVGGEEPVPHDRPYDGTALSKDFMPVAWAAAYGQDAQITSSFYWHYKPRSCSITGT